ncbi:MAG: Fe-S cluster protein [Firmicutes bacterium]|nr:Fe-S cluster protein [Bacillota bacterium]
MYLEDIFITYMQSCIADNNKIRFKADLTNDIAEIFPYLNGKLKDAIFNKKIPAITIRKEFRIITLYNNHMAVQKALNETDAHEIIDYIKDLINKTYNEKENIEPLYKMRSKPTAIEIYNYLPKTNCKKCGEATCLAFATKLLIGQQDIKKCKPLYSDKYKDNLNVIEKHLEMMGFK